MYEKDLYDLLYAPEEQEGKGLGGQILDILGYFDRPRNAIATALSYLPEGLMAAGAGFWGGLTGKEQTSFGDLIGIEPGRSDEEWLPWLAKSGSRLALDVVLDPLNVLFAPAKAAGVFGRAAKALGAPEGKTLIGQAWRHLPEAVQYENIANKLAESSLGQRFAHKLPETEKYGGIEDIIAQRLREGDIYPLQREFLTAEQALGDLLKAEGAPSRRDIFRAAEQVNTDDLDEITRQALDILAPLRKTHEQKFLELSEKKKAHGLPGMGLTPEDFVAYMPHVKAADAPEIMKGREYAVFPFEERNIRRAGNIPYTTDLTQYPAEIQAWKRVDEFGNPIGEPLAIGKFDDPRTPIVAKQLPNGETQFIHKDTGELVVPIRATLEQKSMVLPEGFLIDDPTKALYKTNAYLQSQINFLDLMDDFKKSGLIREIGEDAKLTPGYTQLKIPGFEKFEAPSAVTNRLTNLSKTMWAPTEMPWDEEILRAFAGSKLGKAFSDVTGHWARYALFDPGWAIANKISNIQLPLLHSGMRLRDVPGLQFEAYKTLLGKGDILGMPAKDFLEEMAIRGGISKSSLGIEGAQGLYGSMLRQEGEPGAKTRQVVDWLSGKVGLGELPGKIAQKGVGGIQKITDKFFNLSQKYVEDADRLAVAIDWLKKNAPNFTKMEPAEKARALDKAAAAAKSVLFDYRNLTPYEQNLRLFFPFYAWTRNIMGAAGKAAYEKPNVLANYSRVLNTIFEPLPKEQKEIADDWVKYSAPIIGIPGLGLQFGKDEENRQMMGILARFLPYGQLEGIFKRPTEGLLSMLNPYLKMTVEIPTNYNLFKSRPIDPLAGPVGMFVNPFLGLPHDIARSKPFGTDIPASTEYLLGFIPGGRQMRQVDTLGRALGLWEDPLRGPIEPSDALVWSLSGGKLYPFDIDRALANRLREERAREWAIKSRINYANQRRDEAQLMHYRMLLENELRDRNQKLGEWGIIGW